MLTKSELHSRWGDVKSAVCQRWSNLGGEELDHAKDSVGHVIGLIQQRTGTGRDEIERYLERLVKGRAALARRTVEQSVTDHPIASTMGAFLAGFAAGALIMTSCSRRR